MRGALKFKLKWTDCTNAQKLEVDMYEAGPPPSLVAGTIIDPIPGGANGSITMSLTSPGSAGKKGFIKAKVVNNAGIVIAEETSMTVDVP